VFASGHVLFSSHKLALAFIGGGFLTSAQRLAEIRNQGHDAQPSFALQHDIRLGLGGNQSRAELPCNHPAPSYRQ
jgi:hypothetical protein